MFPAAVLGATIIGCMEQYSRAADMVSAAGLPACGLCWFYFSELVAVCCYLIGQGNR